MTDDKLHKLAQREREQMEVPETVRARVEETLAGLPRDEADIVTLPVKRPARKLVAAIAAAFLAAFLILPNTAAPVARALADIPVIGIVFEAVTFREYSEETASTEVDVKTPKITADGKGRSAAGAVSREIDAMNEAAVAQFKKEHVDGGYGSLDIDYDVVADTGRWYTVRVTREETAASGAVEMAYYTFDKRTGASVILSDLFETDAYIALLSDNIKEQMRAQMKADDTKEYFLDSDLPDEDFREIDPNQDFYFAKNGDLFLCFDEYEVAPGYMGPVRFRVPKQVFLSELQPEYR